MRTADPDLHRRRSDEIAAAAARAFLAKGFHGASMQDVAREAGVSMGLLYRYFADKAALIAAAAALDRAPLLAEIAAVADAPEPADALLALARRMIEAAREPGYVELVAEVAAEACRNPAVAAVLKDDEATLTAALVEALAAHRPAGRVSAEADLPAFATVFHTAVEALALRLRLDPDGDVEPLLAAFAPAICAVAR